MFQTCSVIYDHHLRLSYFYSTGHSFDFSNGETKIVSSLSCLNTLSHLSAINPLKRWPGEWGGGGYRKQLKFSLSIWAKTVASRGEERDI
jgi:hypothetical protein